jgi:intein/homing endonuclease
MEEELLQKLPDKDILEKNGTINFILDEVLPKYVVTSRGDRRIFNVGQISKSLVKETGLDENTAKSIAHEVIRKIIGLGLAEITTNHLRELTCLEMTSRGFHDERNLFVRVLVRQLTKFRLNEEFIVKYRGKQPEWGPLGYITYKRTYARKVFEEDRTEEFGETVQRCVEGCFSLQKAHCKNLSIFWDDAKAQESAQKMFEKIWNFKFLPPGRGLWMMGTKFIDQHGSMSLNNCGFASTDDVDIKGSKAFQWVMDALMLGVGVGFDTRGAGKIHVNLPVEQGSVFVIPDSREGWVQALGKILDAFFYGIDLPEFDYSKIRPAGALIKGFGGIASGPKPLKKMLVDIRKILNRKVGQTLNSVDIVDMFNLIGKCVVSGNVRRSAEIALGNYDDEAYIKMKQDQEMHEHHRWASNNSVFAKKGMDYGFIAGAIAKNGEPGIFWLENAQDYSRMLGSPDFKDRLVCGVNPCFAGSECLLVEIDGNRQYKRLDELSSIQDGNFKIVTPVGVMPGTVFKSSKRETIKVTLGNWDKIIVTPDHIFMTSDGREIEIGDSIGERLRIHSNELEGHDPHWIKLGFIQGDGQLTRLKSERHLGIEINMGVKDGDVKEFFGYDRNDKNRRFYNTEFTEDLNKYGFQQKILPKRTLPDYIPEDKELSFLRGLYTANGSVTSRHRVALKSTCKEMIEEVKELLKKYNIDSYFTTNKPNKIKFKTGEYLCRESYDLNIGNIKGIVTFYEKIGFIHEYKMKALLKLIELKSPKVIKIEENALLDVYDFSVPGVNWGFVNGYVAHNCGEQSLESLELCCLVETFPSRHENFNEYKETLRYAYLYAKSVTLLNTHWDETNAVMLKNRRIGTSQSGIIEAFKKFGRRVVVDWCKMGYNCLKELDEKYSNWLCIPKSIKITTVKPSGTVSLLPGVTPGIHYPHSEYYIRRIRVSSKSELLPLLQDAGYGIEDDICADDTVVVEFPIHEKYFDRAKNDVSMWEQLENGALYQRYWSDNQVSITVTFNKEEAKDLQYALELFEDRLKGVSFLPLKDHGYKQAPYEEISKERYEELVASINPIKPIETTETAKGEKFCDRDTCTLF